MSVENYIRPSAITNTLTASSKPFNNYFADHLGSKFGSISSWSKKVKALFPTMHNLF